MSVERNFLAAEHLESRAQWPDLVVVEFGHRAEPIVGNNPELFSGSRAYIGIEGDLRDPFGFTARKIQDLQSSHRESNMFFISMDLGGVAIRDEGHNSRIYEGPYNCRTLLPNAVANEVFLGNVFGDPHVANSRDRSIALLNEAARLTRSDGMVVIRETITPHNGHHRNRDILALTGLIIGEVVGRDNELWSELESVYGTRSGSVVIDGSHYAFLKKL